MPYELITELPMRVRKNIPETAQKIYKSAFNKAWSQYNYDEARAHQAAWWAVMAEYQQNEKTGQWERLK